MNTTTGKTLRNLQMDPWEQLPNVRFAIYENLKFIGESVFSKENILIGKSREADLVLDHHTIADLHALVEIQPGQSFIFNKNTGNGLRLNGIAIRKSEIIPEDVIQLGPFSIIFRHSDTKEKPATSSAVDIARTAPKEAIPRDTVKNPAPARAIATGEYSVILINQYASVQSRQRAVTSLSKLLRTEYPKVDRVLSKPKHTLKKDLDLESAQKLERALKDAGVLCLVESAADVHPTKVIERFISQDPSSVEPLIPDVPRSTTTLVKSRGAFKALVEEAPVAPAIPGIQATPIAPETPIVPAESAEEYFAPGPLLIDEEDDEEIWEAPFSLKHKLGTTVSAKSRAQRMPAQVQITKALKETVVDTCFLDKGHKYFAHNEYGRSCLVQCKSEDEAHIFIAPGLSGYLISENSSRTDLSTFRSETYRHNRRKEIFKVPLSKMETAVIFDGLCQYTIGMVETQPTPAVQVPAAAKAMDWRHWAYSVGTHLFLLMVLSALMYFQAATPEKQPPHFVKIDLDRLKAQEAKKEEIAPPKVVPPPPPKPEPVRVAETVKPPEKKAPEKVPPKQVPSKNVAKVEPKPNPSASVAAQPSRDPKAGGGFGEGNIANRNINQTGLLSILSKNAVVGPSEAIASVAAVTNIDAVKVPGATGKNFTVGGIKGALGTSKISVGSAGGVAPELLQTKGSTQVLRSAGAEGPGTVAALERGPVSEDQKQVKGLVTAKMTQSVKIEGGMSREMVKQVIDQHMGEITYCYESALSNNPTISGRVIFEWKILMDGRVGEIRIMASTINSHQVHDCIKGAIRSWQFPNPVGSEVIVSYPFVFDLVAF